MVPWNVRNRWDNYVAIIRQMNFKVIHVFREGNVVLMDVLYDQARADFIRNRLGLP